MKQVLRLIVLHFLFVLWMRIKKHFHRLLMEEGVVASLGILDSGAAQNLTKDPSSIANVALHLPNLVTEDSSRAAGGYFDIKKLSLCNKSVPDLWYDVRNIKTAWWFCIVFYCQRCKAKWPRKLLPPIRTFCFDYFTVSNQIVTRNKRYGDSKAGDLQRLPYSKRALSEESVIYVAIVFKVLQSCDAGIASGKTSQDFPVTKCGSHTFAAL